MAGKRLSDEYLFVATGDCGDVDCRPTRCRREPGDMLPVGSNAGMPYLWFGQKIT